MLVSGRVDVGVHPPHPGFWPGWRLTSQLPLATPGDAMRTSFTYLHFWVVVISLPYLLVAAKKRHLSFLHVFFFVMSLLVNGSKGCRVTRSNLRVKATSHFSSSEAWDPGQRLNSLRYPWLGQREFQRVSRRWIIFFISKSLLNKCFY